jgi:hypothetical protein
MLPCVDLSNNRQRIFASDQKLPIKSTRQTGTAATAEEAANVRASLNNRLVVHEPVKQATLFRA